MPGPIGLPIFMANTSCAGPRLREPARAKGTARNRKRGQAIDYAIALSVKRLGRAHAVLPCNDGVTGPNRSGEFGNTTSANGFLGLVQHRRSSSEWRNAARISSLTSRSSNGRAVLPKH